MTKTVTLEIPDNIYTSLLEISAQSGQTLEQMIVEWLAQQMKQKAEEPNHSDIVADAAQSMTITPEFAQQVSDFIEQYRPALEALAK